MKENANDNGKCRLFSKQYLECRMDKGLMARDDMANLGLGDVVDPSVPPPASMQTTSVSPSNPPHVPQPPPSEHRI